MIFRIVILLILTFTFTLEINGQVREFEHFSDDQGLINSHVSVVMKDNEGFVWIGTKQGLDRYDGYTCKHFVNDPFNNESISENNIKCLYESKDGKIYIGFWGRGFSIYDKETGKFENHSIEEGTENTLRKDTIFDFHSDSQGNIWMASNLGLDKYNPIARKTIHFNPFKDLEKKEITSITSQEPDFIWIYGPGNQPCKINLKENSFTFLAHKKLNIKAGSGFHTTILLDKNKNLWFGNQWGGLYKYNTKSDSLDIFHLKNDLLKSNIINCLEEDSEGHIWIGTEGAGLFKYDFEKKDFEKIQYIANMPNNLRSNNISCLHESHPGILWVGSITYGISIFKKNKVKFEKYGIKGDEFTRLNSQSVLSIASAPNDKIWIGTDGGGLNLFDPKTKRFQYFTSENSPLCNNSIKSIYTDARGTMWYGTFEMGLCNVNFKTGAAVNFQKDLIGNEQKGVANCAWTIFRTRENKLWIGLIQGGIKIIDLNTGKFVNILSTAPDFQKLIALRIQVIFEDSKKRIWIGTENYGVICYYPKTKKYIHFEPDDRNPKSIKGKNTKTIYEDSKGNIWFGFQKGGLCKLESIERKTFTTYLIADGLPNNNVKDIIEDKNGNLWLGTEKGVSCFHVKEHFFRNFDMQDGLQGALFHSNSNFKTKDGYIYLGGIDGFNVFHPDSLHFDKVPPKIVITEIKIFDQLLDPNKPINGKKYIKKTVQFIDELELSHSDDVFSIEFASLDFLSPHKNKYAFRLEGFNDKWTYVDAEHRIAIYTNLNPGNYTFHLIASNSDGVWNKEGIRLPIVIHPPIYLTWWFRILAAFFVVAVFFAFYFWRTRSIRLRNLQLKEEVEAQTRKLRETNENLERASKEVAAQANELRKTNEKLQHTAEELAIQNNKSLELYNELTEGLEAGKIIQNAILPGKELLASIFTHIDILYKPKDVVSGDFYWYTKMEGKDVLAVVDCTGHGVAGAFMTFVAYEILNQISKRNIAADPGLILEVLNKEIITSLNHYQTGSINAGMDISICVMDGSNKLLFAGANNPLYINRGEEVLVFKGDRQGIGGKQKNGQFKFSTHEITLEYGDQLYIFTDGYADQMGGENGNEKFMYPRLRQTLVQLRNLDVKERINILGHKFEEWKNGQEQLDDVLIIGFEFRK